MSIQASLGSGSVVQLGVSLADIALIYTQGQRLGNWLRAQRNEDELFEALMEDPEVLLKRRGLVDTVIMGQGQGGAQAIEDAIALGISLVGATPEDLVSGLNVYEKVRRNRASVMQQFSNAAQDEPEKICEEAAEYIFRLRRYLCWKFLAIVKGAGEEKIVSEEMGNRADKDFEETPEQYFEYNFGYDVITDSVQNMQELSRDGSFRGISSRLSR